MKPLNLRRLFLLLVFMALSSPAQGFLTDGLVAYYPFNGNANDASGNGFNPVAVNATLCPDRFGNTNQAYFFNGYNNNIQFSTPPLTQTTNWTLSAWVQPASLYQDGYVINMGWDNGAYGDGYALAVNGGNGFESDGGALGGVFGGEGFFGSGYWFPTNNEWYQVVMLNNAGVTSFYVNGVATPEGNSRIPLVPSSFTIGSAYGVRYFNGAIDEVRIYNRALLTNEVAALYAYSSTPSPHAATGVAILANGFVIAVTITDGGYGYTNTPAVHFVGGGGHGAQGVAIMTNGFVTGVTMTEAGFGYTNAPAVAFDPPYIFNPILNIAPMSFLSFSNLAVGGSYELQQLAGWYWTNQAATFTAASSVFTQMVAGAAGSSQYRLALNPSPSQAFATPQIVNGFVVGATVTSGGSGYVSSPAVEILGHGGTNATATAQISGGVVTSVSITDAGIGYTNTTRIEIAPPPAAAIFPNVQPVMRLDSARLAPFATYQIQFAPIKGGAWENWNGGLFVPTSAVNSQFLFITNGTGFFRLLYQP